MKAAARFRAFVSYSHADSKIARRLQKRLEAYRIPKRLAGRVAPLGDGPGRVGPVFRDREDLPASADLSEAVRTALADSKALIVLCSPEAACSIWVAKEITLFRALHPDGPVLAALIRGSLEDSLPAELRQDGAEPLAADFRRAGDGRKLAFLKVVAGILGIPLDELIQREGQRRQRRVMAVTTAALVAMLVLATMTIVAIQARKEAERQRAEAERQQGEAEGLVEYMLTGLREGLKQVGRIDIMRNVDREVTHYYKRQSALAALSDERLERRARAIEITGEDEELLGNLDAALARYSEVARTTRALLAKNPADASRVLAHARSENRLALLWIAKKNFAAALPHLAETRRLLRSVAAWGAGNGDWLQLAAFAEGNTGATLLKRGDKGRGPLDYCRRAVSIAERRMALDPSNPNASYDLTFHLFWLAEAQLAAGLDAEAGATQARYLALTRKLTEGGTTNTLLLEQQMELYFAQAQFLRDRGETRRAEPFLDQARSLNRKLVALEPRNAVWKNYQERLSARQERSP